LMYWVPTSHQDSNLVVHYCSAKASEFNMWFLTKMKSICSCSVASNTIITSFKMVGAHHSQKGDLWGILVRAWILICSHFWGWQIIRELGRCSLIVRLNPTTASHATTWSSHFYILIAIFYVNIYFNIYFVNAVNSDRFLPLKVKLVCQ